MAHVVVPKKIPSEDQIWPQLVQIKKEHPELFKAYKRALPQWFVVPVEAMTLLHLCTHLEYHFVALGWYLFRKLGQMKPLPLKRHESWVEAPGGGVLARPRLVVFPFWGRGAFLKQPGVDEARYLQNLTLLAMGGQIDVLDQLDRVYPHPPRLRRTLVINSQGDVRMYRHFLTPELLEDQEEDYRSLLLVSLRSPSNDALKHLLRITSFDTMASHVVWILEAGRSYLESNHPRNLPLLLQYCLDHDLRRPRAVSLVDKLQEYIGWAAICGMKDTDEELCVEANTKWRMLKLSQVDPSARGYVRFAVDWFETLFTYSALRPQACRLHLLRLWYGDLDDGDMGGVEWSSPVLRRRHRGPSHGRFVKINTTLHLHHFAIRLTQFGAKSWGAIQRLVSLHKRQHNPSIAMSELLAKLQVYVDTLVDCGLLDLDAQE